ncbi:MAG: peroxide stress protein YaaA [Chloroflexi bacterium]|nr:peroxide stress protein YaaA [Chloroflexota bacterium]
MTPTAPLILLPPSEGKASGGDGAALELGSLSFGALNPTRTRMAKALVELSGRPRVARKILGVKDAALEQAKAENASLETAPTMRAIDRYTGVMYGAIDYPSLDDIARESFSQNVIIMSGLFGVVRPFDMIPAYKLKMGAKLIRSKSCAAVWKPLISKSLSSEEDYGVIWDLLPGEHSAAWDPTKVPHEARFTVKFLERHADGQIKTVTHFSKLLKGALVRHLVENTTAAGSTESALELAAGFSHPEGHEFRAEMTSEIGGATELVFLKDVGG